MHEHIQVNLSRTPQMIPRICLPLEFFFQRKQNWHFASVNHKTLFNFFIISISNASKLNRYRVTPNLFGHISTAGVAVKMHSPKKVLPSTSFRENKYSPVYISQVKITSGITFVLGNNYSFGKKSTSLHGHNFLQIIFFHGLERLFQYLSLATRETVYSILLFRIGSLWLGSLWLG